MIFDREYVITVIADRVKKEWRTADTGTVPFLEEIPSKEEHEQRISRSTELLMEQLNRFPYPIGNKKRWKKKTEEMLDQVLWQEPLLGIREVMTQQTLSDFKKEMQAFIGRVRQFDPSMNIEDLGQALRNYIVYAVFRELNGVAQECTSSIFGYSMLYPYTDNYIDSTERSEEEKRHFNQLIADQLRTGCCRPQSMHEEKTEELLRAVEKDYERSDEIYTGLLLMLEAQKNSQVQYDKDRMIGEETILDISLCKGGLSVLIDRYLVPVPMDEDDVFFYYGFGFLLQLCDDLQDITQDLKENSSTVFSASLTKESCAENVNKLLNYTQRIFTFCKSENEEFKVFLLKNCYFLILFSAAGSRENMTPKWLAWAEKRMPVSLSYYDNFKKSFSKDGFLQEDSKYKKMIDEMLK